MTRVTGHLAVWISISAATAMLDAGAVLAHRGATGVVKERMVLMSTVGKSMKMISGMLTAKTPYNARKLRNAARRIASHGGERITKLFPEGSIKGPSTSLPAIWQDWELFAAYAADMRKYALALERAASNPRHTMRETTIPLHGPGGMMGGERDPKMTRHMLARMAPEAAFARLTRTCGACHTRFRRQR